MRSCADNAFGGDGNTRIEEDVRTKSPPFISYGCDSPGLSVKNTLQMRSSRNSTDCFDG